MWITLDFQFPNTFLQGGLEVRLLWIEGIFRDRLIEWRLFAHLPRSDSFSHNSSPPAFSIRESKCLNPDEAFSRSYVPIVHLLPKALTSPNTEDRSDSVHLACFETAGLKALRRNRGIKKVERRWNWNQT